MWVPPSWHLEAIFARWSLHSTLYNLEEVTVAHQTTTFLFFYIYGLSRTRKR